MIHQQLYDDLKDFIIEEKPFLQDSLTVCKEIPQAVVSSCKSTGCFVFTDNSGEKGTLEDWLYPLFLSDNETLMNRAANYIDTFTWNESITSQASRKKAIMCCAGQRKKPGLSYTIILKEGDMIGKQSYKDASAIKTFCGFLESFAGLQPK
ncbi:MAG: hypothetical protein JXB88_25095 [Spirochaetales bacterium]|nr:hypothetical protein [Spirochaetales bacterium]